MRTRQDFERQVWTEAKKLFNNPKLQLSDLLEWSLSKATVMRHMEAGDVIAGLPCGFSVCILKKHDKRKAAKAKGD